MDDLNDNTTTTSSGGAIGGGGGGDGEDDIFWEYYIEVVIDFTIFLSFTWLGMVKNVPLSVVVLSINLTFL